MVQITIDGKKAEAKKGEYLLAVLRREGVDVPALCHHEAVEPAGACRLCSVEISKPSWKGWKKTVTSCLYPVEEGLVVETNTEKIHRLRKELLDLLLARSPESDVIKALAAKYGVYETSYEPRVEADNCILCGLCVRVCQTLITGAISMTNRGIEKKVSTPFDKPSQLCIGCLSCAQVCPTGAISYKDEGLTREIWGKKFKLVRCIDCGVPTKTEEHISWLSDKTNITKQELAICDRCKAKKTADLMASLQW